MIVAFTVSCARQKYLHQALVSWARVRGIDGARLVFALEPPGTFPLEAFANTVAATFKGGTEVHAARRQLECLANTRRAVDLAFATGGDFAVLAEEDLEVADDTLEYLAWARDAYRADRQVLAVCAHARSSRLDDPSAVVTAPWFNPLVWGTWRDRWEKVIAPNWKPGHESNPQSWDLNMMHFTRDNGYRCVFPVRSRVIHRGVASTQTHYPLSEYLYSQFLSDVYAPHYEPQAYHEIPFPDRAGDLVV